VGDAEPAIGPRRFIVQAEASALYCLLAHRTRKLSRHWSFPYSGDAGRSAKPGNLHAITGV
jgi:hypothetical protein